MLAQVSAWPHSLLADQQRDVKPCRFFDYLQAENVPGSKLSGDAFIRFWISYSQGTITVGLGKPSPENCHFSWSDSSPIPNLKHVGLSSWDKHVGYKRIQMQPAVSLQRSLAQQDSDAGPACGAPSLTWLCRQSIEQHLDTPNLCSILHGLELLAPALDDMKEPLMACLADNLQQIIDQDPTGFCMLPCTCLSDLLDSPRLVMPYCCTATVPQRPAQPPSLTALHSPCICQL